MELLILRKEEQAQGAFDGGRILERKPIGFPQDNGRLRPYSNLFYWAFAWAKTDSVIGEHPHKGFEIMSFVLKGRIHHFDSQLRGWKELHEGDVQIIRAGSGITHAERMYKGSEIFQIWFDPGLDRTLSKSATYNDYTASTFTWEKSACGETLEYVGTTKRIPMDSRPLGVHRHRFMDGEHSISAKDKEFHSHFILSGSVVIDGQKLEQGDFFRVSGAASYRLDTTGAELFTITGSEKLDYRTYNEMMQARAQ
ncbi:MAG: pirin family protein [Flavobacteriales bacterium]|nr:pirin family protein [Flavobacteriales bacterium]